MATSSGLSRAAFLTLSLAGVLASVLVSGCYAEAQTGAVVTTTYVPAHVELYPREYYDGHTVYLIDDHWYYHDGAQWVYYRHEPEVLVRRRVVIHQAPPVVREQTVVHQAPVVREQSVVHEAPPAHQHRHYESDPARRQAERHEHHEHHEHHAD